MLEREAEQWTLFRFSTTPWPGHDELVTETYATTNRSHGIEEPSVCTNSGELISSLTLQVQEHLSRQGTRCVDTTRPWEHNWDRIGGTGWLFSSLGAASR